MMFAHTILADSGSSRRPVGCALVAGGFVALFVSRLVAIPCAGGGVYCERERQVRACQRLCLVHTRTRIVVEEE